MAWKGGFSQTRPLSMLETRCDGLSSSIGDIWGKGTNGLTGQVPWLADGMHAPGYGVQQLCFLLSSRAATKTSGMHLVRLPGFSHVAEI